MTFLIKLLYSVDLNGCQRNTVYVLVMNPPCFNFVNILWTQSSFLYNYFYIDYCLLAGLGSRWATGRRTFNVPYN